MSAGLQTALAALLDELADVDQALLHKADRLCVVIEAS